MRYRWDPELRRLVDASAPTRSEGRLQLMTDGHYAGLRASDGTDIGSRARWQAYARQRGLTHMSDFKEHWQKKAKERAAVARGEHDVEARRRDVAEAYRKVEAGYRPRREQVDPREWGVVERFIPQ